MRNFCTSRSIQQKVQQNMMKADNEVRANSRTQVVVLPNVQTGLSGRRCLKIMLSVTSIAKENKI